MFIKDLDSFAQSLFELLHALCGGLSTNQLFVIKVMKYKSLLLAAAPVVFLAACASGPQPAPAAAVPDCVFPDGSGEPAPGWICDEPVPGVAVSAVGVYGPTRAGISFQKTQAAGDARGKLAEQFQVQVDKMVKSYLGTTGIGDSETVDSVSQSVLKTVSSETLYGSKIFKSRVGPDGSMYVLVGLDEENTRQAAAQAVENSMSKDQALWQEFKAQQGFDEMAEAISNQPIE